MSELTQALIGAGAILALAVGLHGYWQVKKRLPKTAKGLGFTPRPSQQAHPSPHTQQLHQPQLEPTWENPSADLPNARITHKAPTLDWSLDCVAPLHPAHPVSGEAAMGAFPSTHRVGAKSLALDGLNAASMVWETPRSGGWYSELRLGIQLANRRGALNEVEFSEFIQKVNEFAESVEATPDLPDMTESVSQARELDQFASNHDAQLQLILQANSVAWSPGYVHQHAAKRGFVPGAIPGRWVVPAAQEDAPPVLVLSYDTQIAFSDDPANQSIRHITLSLDVPHISQSERPFERLKDTAIGLIAVMDGRITDVNGQSIGPAQLAQIENDLAVLYAALEARELSAGSVLARRLFS